MSMDNFSRLSELGVATLYEASGREGLIDIPLFQIIPNSRVAGAARTVLRRRDQLVADGAPAQPAAVVAAGRARRRRMGEGRARAAGHE